MTDAPIIEYAKQRVKEITARNRSGSNQRYRLLTLPAVMLRDEGGLSVASIAEELGTSHDMISRALAHFDYGPPDLELSTREIRDLYPEHTLVEISAITGRPVPVVKEILG